MPKKQRVKRSRRIENRGQTPPVGRSQYPLLKVMPRTASRVTPRMQTYIDSSKEYLSQRARYIKDVVKKWKFDTIAVHGLYTVQDAIEDYQGAIIEPIFMSTAQAYRDSDEMAAALAYLIPPGATRASPTPRPITMNGRWPCWRATASRAETSCCSTSSGMAAIMTAVQPFLCPKTPNEPRNFVATAQCYGGTFQQFCVR